MLGKPFSRPLLFLSCYQECCTDFCRPLSFFISKKKKTKKCMETIKSCKIQRILKQKTVSSHNPNCLLWYPDSLKGLSDLSYSDPTYQMPSCSFASKMFLLVKDTPSLPQVMGDTQTSIAQKSLQNYLLVNCIKC